MTTPEDVIMQNEALQQIEHGVVLVNTGSDSVKVNGAAAALLAMPSGQQPKDNFLEALIALGSRRPEGFSVEDDLRRIMESSDIRVSKWMWHLGNPSCHVNLSTYPLSANGAHGRVWVFNDVSDLFEARSSKYKLKHRLQRLLTDGDVIALRIRPGGVIDWVSPSTMRMTGFEESAYLGRNAKDFCHPGDLPGFMRIVESVRATGMPQQLAMRMTDASGHVRSLEGRIFLADDGSDCLEVIFSDVTKHVELNIQRIAVTSTVSHEFKTPLAFISSVLEMIRDETLDPTTDQGREALDRMIAASARLARMSDELLGLQRLEITRALVAHHPIRVTQHIHEVVSTLPTERNVSVVVRDLSDGGEIVVDGDLLEQAVINLLDNAIRHSPDGGVVHVEVHADEGEAMISVRDHGPGVPPNRRTEIFRPFMCIDSSRKRTGLGLAIVDRIAKLHNGSITVGDADAQGGAVFTLILREIGGAP